MGFRVLVILFLMSSQCFSAEVSGIKLPDEDQKLVLNGAGLRKRAFFSVYVIGLYLPQKKTVAADIVGLAGPKRVLIHMMRDVDAATFTDALTDGMKENVSESEMKNLDPQLKQLSAIMNQLKVAREGMRITLDWVPGSGTAVGVNAKPAGAPIAGEDFYRALLRIWLGEKPVQDDLKKALLGG